MPQNLRKKAKLAKQLTEHMESKGCFACKAKSHANSNLQCAHVIYEKKATKVKSMLQYWASHTRMTETDAMLEELMKCGILCRTCHNVYDKPYRYPSSGFKKARFDARFKASGTKAADWGAWREDYLTLAAKLDSAP